MLHLNGVWIYQSFRRFTGPPSPLVPWSPVGKLSVTTDETGKVQGKLTMPLPPGAPVPELVLTVSGSITPAAAGPMPMPEGVELTGKAVSGDGIESANELRGYLVAGGNGPVIAGIVVAVRNDPAGEPDGTDGPFVLFPAAE